MGHNLGLSAHPCCRPRTVRDVQAESMDCSRTVPRWPPAVALSSPPNRGCRGLVANGSYKDGLPHRPQLPRRRPCFIASRARSTPCTPHQHGEGDDNDYPPPVPSDEGCKCRSPRRLTADRARTRLNSHLRGGRRIGNRIQQCAVARRTDGRTARSIFKCPLRTTIEPPDTSLSSHPADVDRVARGV